MTSITHGMRGRVRTATSTKTPLSDSFRRVSKGVENSTWTIPPSGLRLRFMWYINTPQELAEFAEKHELRRDWHEPDEQDIDATILGCHLDNAHGSRGFDLRKPMNSLAESDNDVLGLRGYHDEMRVVLHKRDGGSVLAVINLASLLAWASAPHRPRIGHKGHVHVDMSKGVDTAAIMDLSIFSTLELMDELRRRETTR